MSKRTYPDLATSSYVALDFETADQGKDSACQLAMVRVERGRIKARYARLIRPPRRDFQFTYIHGITWDMVKQQPTFLDLWPEIAHFLDGADFLAAHNAGFDRAVMAACCAAAGVAPPQQAYLCTVQLARDYWNIRPTKLPDVCGRLGIPLKHHDAASDAEACARILLHARLAGVAV
jgi:DNA polymerase-3 subunit epsilon